MLLLMEICCQPHGILSEEAVDEEELVEREEATGSHIDSNFSASARKLKKNTTGVSRRKLRNETSSNSWENLTN